MSRCRALVALMAFALLIGSCADDTNRNTVARVDAPVVDVEAEVEAPVVDADAPGDAGADLDAAIERLNELKQMPFRFESFLDGDAPVMRLEFDGTWSLVTSLLGPNQRLGEPMSFSITDRTTAYYFIPGLRSAPEAQTVLGESPMRDAIDAWISVDGERLKALSGSEPEDLGLSAVELVDELIETFESAGSATEGPRSTSRGIETRTLELVIEQDSEPNLFDARSVLTIHLDDENRVREVISESDVFGQSRVEFFDFGAAIEIELPIGALDRTEAFAAMLNVDAAMPDVDEAGAEVPDPTPTPVRAGPTLLDLIDAQPELATFRSLITEANLESVFARPDSELWTVLAPTNDALASVATLDEIRQSPPRLQTFVADHLIPGAFNASALVAAGSVQTIEGFTLTITGEGEIVVINGTISAIFTDIDAVDGVMHIVTRPVVRPS